SAIQAGGVAGAPGDNTVAVALAQLADKSLPALSNQTLLQNYGQTVATLGQSLNGTNTQLTNQQIVENMLLRQRDSVSGVSIDEEMAGVSKFQRACAAAGKLITTGDSMLETGVNLKR